MSALELLAAVNVKVVGVRALNGRPLPMLGMRPKIHALDLRGGIPNPRTPLEQALAETGFTHLVPSDGIPETPHPDWTITLPSSTSYRIDYQGETQFKSGLPTPELWGVLVREAGWCALVLQREAGPDVRGKELLTEMDAGNCFAVTARLV
ncbi:hypothetical protein [Streptomyces sp. CA-106110]|uniref:hypothetical protein n=1 Tax=Streptomyces sp. CA-106110 TaxID=3240044 RepID=UPI003D9283BF